MKGRKRRREKEEREISESVTVQRGGREQRKGNDNKMKERQRTGEEIRGTHRPDTVCRPLTPPETPGQTENIVEVRHGPVLRPPLSSR